MLALALFAGGLSLYLKKRNELLEARYARGLVLVERGDYEGAVKVLQGLHRDHPSFAQSPQALFQAAEILNINLRRYQESLLAYLLVIKDSPESPLSTRALRQVAKVYKYRLQDYSAAIVAYQKLLDQGAPEADRYQYELADAYFRLNNFEQARIEFDTLLKDHAESPLVPEVQYRIAVCFSLEGELAKAEKAFRIVPSRWPDSPYALEAHFGLAGVLEESERLTESLETLEGLKEGYPNQEALGKKLDQVRERIRKKKQAI